jgi:MutL protein
VLIGTGGALTRLPGGHEMLAATRAPETGGDRLLPPADAVCALDADYVMADCGALLSHFEGAAVVALMRTSLGL